MLFSELLRITVLLVAGVATALAALAVLVIQNEDSTFAAIFGGAWWLTATAIGLVLGTPARAAEAISPALRAAAIGAGYALLIALLWRRREDAVRAIEDRDGVRFYVEPTSAFEPIRLVRTPGLYRDRPPKPKPPDPPPEDR